MARWMSLGLTLALVAAFMLPLSARAQGTGYEVWVVDQADATKDGAKLYIYPGSALGASQFTGQPEVVDLETASQGVGDGPGTRPHLLLFNESHTHAVLAYVASGHVQVIRAADRKVVYSVDVGMQAHGALPSPDGSYILVANQNGKRLAKITSDFEDEEFSYDPEADLDLRDLQSEDLPDNAPICPILYPPGTDKAYVTLRGGGLIIVDTGETPMEVLKTFTKDQVAPAGCGGVIVGDKMYVNSGTATSSSLYVFDTKTDTLVKSIPITSGTDAHGMVVVGNGRYLWMTNRGDGDDVVVVDTTTDTVVGTFTNFGKGPDLMDVSPAGDRVVVSLRGPLALTGGPSAVGETPGFAVLSVSDGGRTGSRAMFVPIGSQAADSAADPHAIAIRHLPGAAPAAAPAVPVPAAPPAAPAAPIVPQVVPSPSPVATPAPARAPAQLPRTGDLAGLVSVLVPVGVASLLGGVLLRRRRN